MKASRKKSTRFAFSPVLPVGRFSRPIGLVSIRSCGKVLRSAGCGFLGYFLFKAAGFWAGKILSFNRTTLSYEKLSSLASRYVQTKLYLVSF